MKKDATQILDRVMLGVVWALSIGTLLAISHDRANAGSDDAEWITQGTYMEMRRVHVTSDTAALLWPESRKRVNSTCQAIGGTIWIGTNTAASPSVTHPNIQVGQMITASGTVTLGGAYSGALYATGEVNTATVTFRCLDQLVR